MKFETTPLSWELLSEAISRIQVPVGRICLVGGSVRDFIREGRVGPDLDLVVEEDGGAEKLARELSRVFGDRASQPHPLGRGYPIWQLVVDDLEIQIADTQKEMFPDPTSRARVTRFGSLDEDCARRDFSVNMLYWDLRAHTLLDPSGRGLADIKARLLAPHPRVDPNRVFADDPLRMLRLLRFRTKLGFDVHPALWVALDSQFDRVSILSAERVRDEMMKVLASGGLADFLETLRERAHLATLFPELVPMLGCGQDPTYHSEGDVWVHTLMVMRASAPTPALQLAALLHDVGKPATREEKGARVSFILHERVSVEIARAWLTKWRFQKDLRERVLTLVALHLRGGDVESWRSLRPARKLLRDAGDALGELLQLIEADSKSSLGPDGKPRTQHLQKLATMLDEAARVSTPLRSALSGRLIMERFGVSEGPEVKRLKMLADEIREEILLEGREAREEEILQKVAVLIKNENELP